MTPHWTEQKDVIRDWVRANPGLLVGCDFDGTLSPLVEHAADAAMLPAARTALLRLSQMDRVTVAIISGRALADLLPRVQMEGLYCSGNHGLEMLAPGGTRTLAPHAEESVPALRLVLERLSTGFTDMRGVWIEDKGLTATVHYRLADPFIHPSIGVRVADMVGGAPSLVIRQGKFNWEIRPALAWNKGTALLRFMECCQLTSKACSFMGDDVTDYDAFAVLPDGLSFIVGRARGHPATQRTDDPEDTARLLAWLADECEEAGIP